QIVPADLVRNHRGNEQGDDGGGQEPSRPEDQLGMKREIQAADREHGDERRPTRLGVASCAARFIHRQRRTLRKSFRAGRLPTLSASHGSGWGGGEAAPSHNMWRSTAPAAAGRYFARPV